MRIGALVIRILRQFLRDKRTMALMILAPILILSMLHLVFNGDDYTPKIGLVGFPEQVINQMDLEDAKISEYESTKQAKTDLSEQEIDGYLKLDGQTPSVVVEGSDPSVNGAVMKWMNRALKPLQQDGAPEPEVDYYHGSSEMGQFDYFGPVLLGFFAFFFVFLIAGVSFLRERTTGTLERLLSSPLRRWEIVVGYVLGFGIFTMLQAGIIAWYAIYVLNMMMEGSFLYVLLITLILSLSALTLGILLSAFANNELQMIQFIPIVVVPQIFFSGLFNLETISDWLSWIGPFTPLFYAADALRDVMVRGYGLGEIYIDLLVLAGFSILFMFLNIITLKRYRKI
ncbi:ABC transporter permease [Bacillus canaveralius]|uniref:ABC transporter permease n=1 Tax=Bacillus canaveralius TaxID=1403243 RepID=A0A2N5GK14_9BACI|nr:MULTISPECIES: ABC transporter permease [Bacillus]PLR81604.1 ABC transporter permease [Bacillus canaveralius]PLR85551.1 ABC transporter permease [Bacillus sp. V33-4]PLR90855.1 ABC transporter permease [Bacillus canaveralius]RSK57575.1 ABC transporter permease [Bacillus canaveralius]